jgi:REP element-mobilizing transposase RayT
LKIPKRRTAKYRFVVHGYVIMPEHFHLLITEPEVGDPSVVRKVLKERFSREVSRKPGAGCPTHRAFCDEWVSAHSEYIELTTTRFWSALCELPQGLKPLIQIEGYRSGKPLRHPKSANEWGTRPL